MRHFSYIEKEILNSIFYKLPEEVSKETPKEVLKYALGATLYAPGTKKDIDEFLLNKRYPELSSFVICLEDSISDSDLDLAENNLVKVLKNIYKEVKNKKINKNELPLIFIRVRNPKHLKKIAEKIQKYSEIIVGFNLPKFDEINGREYLENLLEINKKYNVNYYCMPILESENIVYIEKRIECLMFLSKLFSEYKDIILNLRIGATDFSSYFGLRRNRDFTVYDIQIIRDCITDILNIFSRNEEDFIISGPVWEYFERSERILKPRLRATIFKDHLGLEGKEVRAELMKKNLDGFIKEILLDKENGIVGKTVIHPTHISLVNSLYVVSHEEYLDAIEILNYDGNGVIRSHYNNKMNEIKPHRKWAEKIISRGKIFGVYNEGKDFIFLLSHSTS